MGPGADCADTTEEFDYDAYRDFLGERWHNFIRLWRWEQFRSQAAGGLVDQGVIAKLDGVAHRRQPVPRAAATKGTG